MKRIYVAGPVSSSPESCAITAIMYANVLLVMGYAPFVPHLFVYWDKHFPHTYEEWMDLCFEWIKQCDCMFRVPGKSPGAEREIAYAKKLGIPVFYTLEEAEKYLRL